VNIRKYKIYKKTNNLPPYHKVHIHIDTLEVTPPCPISVIELSHVNYIWTSTHTLRAGHSCQGGRKQRFVLQSASPSQAGPLPREPLLLNTNMPIKQHRHDQLATNFNSKTILILAYTAKPSPIDFTAHRCRPLPTYPLIDVNGMH
jgi:hypothetical protein